MYGDNMDELRQDWKDIKFYHRQNNMKEFLGRIYSKEEYEALHNDTEIN